MNQSAGFLFDVDGVLLDGAATYIAGWSHWARMHSLDVSVVVSTMHGRRPIDVVAAMAPHLDPAEEVATLSQLLAEQPPVPAMPGALRLLRAIPSTRWSIVTSSRRQHITRCFAASGLPLPTVAIFGEDVAEGKPSPTGYLRAAELLGADPSSCLIVEDSPAGIAAGKAAGSRVVGLATTHLPEQLNEADVVFPTLAAATEFLLKQMEESREDGPLRVGSGTE